MTAEQFTLAVTLPLRRARGRDDFLVSASNKTALAAIDAWRDWPNGQMALTGPAGAGKTHLAHVWMAAAGAERVRAATLSAADAPTLIASGAVAVEEADRLDGDPAAEEGLFHLLNLARAEGAKVLLTGRAAPPRWPILLPDLASRVAGFPVARVEEADDPLLRDLLVRHFRDRHLRVEDQVIAYLVTRIERSAAAAAEAAQRLDEAALAASKRLTKPFVRQVLGL